MSGEQIKIYIKVQYGTFFEVRSDRTSENLNIEICDLDVNNHEVLKATTKKWDLETNQLHKAYSYDKNKARKDY